MAVEQSDDDLFPTFSDNSIINAVDTARCGVIQNMYDQITTNIQHNYPELPAATSYPSQFPPASVALWTSHAGCAD